MDAIADFVAAIERAGLPVPETVLADGALHRFGTNGTRRDDSGWYVLRDGVVPSGAFGDWRAGFKQKWRANIGRKLTDAERGALRKQRLIERLKRKQETERLHREAAEFAAGYTTLPAAPAGHPYFVAKGITAPIRIDEGGLLVVPMYSDGKIVNLQTIDSEGAKRYLSGGRVKGCYFAFGEITDSMIVCEGLATGASIHAATGGAVAVAFDAGNLLPVAEALRKKYPTIEIAIAADNDLRTDGTENTGVVKATAAAKAIKGRVVVPELAGRKCDFNDVHAELGLGAVREQCSIPPSPPSAAPELEQPNAVESGEQVLDACLAFIGLFCAFPDKHCLPAVTLWIAHAHAADSFYITPRLVLLSTEPESGKTRVLEIASLLAPNGWLVVGPSAATVFRKLAAGMMTLLLDETDTIWSPQKKDDGNEDLRGLLNAGYKKGAVIPRCVGNDHEVVDFSAFCPVMMAGLKDLPDTILTRSVIIRMRRRKPDEKVIGYRGRKHDPIGHALHGRLAQWVSTVARSVGRAEPPLPDGVDDRAAEIWEPLIAIADAAGGHWPQTAREACSAFVARADRRGSLGVRLLTDIKTLFTRLSALSLSSAAIIEELIKDEEAPWTVVSKGKPIDSRLLANILGDYSIKSAHIRCAVTNKAGVKGYRQSSFVDAWSRYVPVEGQHGQQDQQPSSGAASGRGPHGQHEVNTPSTEARAGKNVDLDVDHGVNAANPSAARVVDHVDHVDPTGKEAGNDDGWTYI